MSQRSFKSVRCLHINVRHVLGSLEVCPGTRALDDFLDNLLDLVPIIVWKSRHLNSKVFLDLLDHLVAKISSDQADRDAHTSETPGTTNSMKISLRVSIAAIVVRKVLRRSQPENQTRGAGMTYVVDHQGNGLYVDTARKDVGSDENLGET